MGRLKEKKPNSLITLIIHYVSHFKKEEKMKKRKAFIRVLIGILGLIVLFGFGTAMAKNPGVTDTTIKVGSILDQTGPIAYYGKVSAQAIVASVNEINSKGGIHGRKIVFLTESDEYNPAKHHPYKFPVKQLDQFCSDRKQELVQQIKIC